MRGFAIVMLCIEILFTAEEVISLCRGKNEALDLITYGVFTLAVIVVLIVDYAMLTSCTEFNDRGIRQTVFRRLRRTTHEYSWDDVSFVGKAYVRGDGRLPCEWYIVCSDSAPEYEYKNSKACTFKSKNTIYIENNQENTELLKPYFKG